ncbi:hypothetical protein [Rickettsiella endosymbiont of Miltochrista miniata]|uniref:hypothetical protein n=1 Tax=Rickettsiella endosymbiont of Miltochrista miniata TaxID=3066239 RepID=UPI00313C4188
MTVSLEMIQKNETYKSLSKKQQALLNRSWTIAYIAKVAACSEHTESHNKGEGDILREIASMRENPIDFTEEALSQEPIYFSEKDIEDIIWIASSCIRVFDMSFEQRKMAWSTLENICKDNEIFSRHISLEFMLDSLSEILKGHKDIRQELKPLLDNIEKEEEKIDSETWCKYASFFYERINPEGLAWFSLLSIMFSLKLPHLHIANQQSISLYCKLFMRDHINLDINEEKIYNDIIEQVGPLKCTAKGLAEYLQKMTDLVKSTEELRAAFSEGIITAMPRERVKQLIEIVRCLTERDIVCIRLSSSFPSEIALTQSKNYNINHCLLPIENYKKISKGEGFNEAHRIMPRYDFDHVKIIKEQKAKYTRALRYVNTLFTDQSFTDVGEERQTIKQISPT